MEIRRVLSRPAIFSFANRAEDIEALNAILARLRQQFRTKPSLEIYERVNAAYQAGTPVPTLFAVVVRDIQNQPPESDFTTEEPALGQIKSLIESALRRAQKPKMIGLLGAE